ncbi:LysM peptidoglycan-binding domain-containing protein [Haloferula sp.]|uniref:LysM peptidoglycan-binding domain-containing protein n=1 Tax=Haloferula sp. TaxID=2497595 RepID=UPI00329E32EF
MSKSLTSAIAAAITLGVSGCGSFGTAENPTGTGPFDSRGNYVEAWADNPSKWNGRSVPPPGSTPPEVAKNDTPSVAKPSQSQTTTVSNPKPKPRPVSKPKPKPKPKPRTTIHTVRKGDTLYGLAKKYGTSWTKIQKANGISGSTIRIGQKLKIPR